MKNPKLAFFVSVHRWCASAKAITHGSANHLSSSVIYSSCPPWILLELLIPLIWKTFLHTQCVLKYYCNKRSGYFKYLSLPALPKYGHKRSFADIFLEEGAEKRGVIDAQPYQKTNRKTHQKNLRKDQSSAVLATKAELLLRDALCCTIENTLFQRETMKCFNFCVPRLRDTFPMEGP